MNDENQTKNGEIPSLSLLFPSDKFPDRSTRWLLEFGENVRGLLEIVAADLVDILDFSRLTQVNRSFVPDNLREQESDVVYRVPFRDKEKGEVWIYVLIEHQSTVDVVMGFRMLFYMVQIWDTQRREWEDQKVPRSQWHFAPIISIALHTGDNEWNVPITMDAVMELPDALKRFVPRFDTLFLGVKASDEAILTKTDHPFGWLMTVLQKEHSTKAEIMAAMKRAVSHINNTLSAEESNQWRRAIFYLYLLILHRRPPDEHDELKTLVYEQITEPERRKEGETMAQTMADHLLQQGEQRGEQRGIEIGSLQAKRQDIVELLQIRFHTVPATLVEHVNAINSLERLNAVFKQAATVESIDHLQLGNTTE